MLSHFVSGDAPFVLFAAPDRQAAASSPSPPIRLAAGSAATRSSPSCRLTHTTLVEIAPDPASGRTRTEFGLALG